MRVPRDVDAGYDIIVTSNYRMVEVKNNEANVFRVFVDGTDCITYDGFMKTFSRSFDFPDYFGGNWSAFDECINDLDWLSFTSVILSIQNFHLLLKDSWPDKKTFVKLISSAKREWKLGMSTDGIPKSTHPFIVFIIVNDSNRALILTELKKLNCSFLTDKT